MKDNEGLQPPHQRGRDAGSSRDGDGGGGGGGDDAVGGVGADGRLLLGASLVLLAVAGLAAFDLFVDLEQGTTLGHVAAEAGVVALGLVGATFIGRRLVHTLRDGRAARAEARALAARLSQTQAEAARFRAETKELSSGLGSALDRQFDRWQLSPAEKEVALLLLKGLSHKEIGAARQISEATARQQARAVYRKAGLSGRNDLAAFFLEDLLLPASQR